MNIYKLKSPQVTFSAIYSEHEKPVFNYILRMVQDRADAEDLTQELFVRVYQNLPDFRADARVSTWIYRLATNICLDHFRKKSYLQKKKTESLEMVVSNRSDTTTPFPVLADKAALRPDEVAIRSDMKEQFHYFLRQLSENYRTVFILAELQELKNQEIADILDCSLETVKIRRHRARKQVKKLLETCCTIYYDDNGHIDWDEK